MCWLLLQVLFLLFSGAFLDKQSLLNLLLWLPFCASLLLWLLPIVNKTHNQNEQGKSKTAIHITLSVFLFQFAIAVCFWTTFNVADGGLQYSTKTAWISNLGVDYFIGLEGINLLIIMLTTLIFPIVMFMAYSQVQKNIKLFCVMMLFMQWTVLGALLAQNLFLFYVFWEAMLIPAFVFIVVWGGKDRISAVYRFFIYTAFGSILMLGAIIYLGWQTQQINGFISFNYDAVFNLQIPLNAQLWLFTAFAIAFAIKLPLFPFHSWQAITYTQAPVLATVIFAAVLSKVGAYGLIKLAFPLFPQAVSVLSPLLIFLAVVGIVYGALIAFVQTQIKSLLAFSSLSHLGFVLLAISSFNIFSAQGALMHLFSHGLVVTGLFLLVAILANRFNENSNINIDANEINNFSGLTKITPSFAKFFVILSLASVGLPTTSGFVGEFLILLGAFTNSWALYENAPMLTVMVVFATAGVIFSAMYMLKLCQKLLFGALHIGSLTLSNEEINSHKFDLRGIEKMLLTFITIVIFVLGLYPQFIFNKTNLAVETFAEKMQIINIKNLK